jgi:hypothetical protein
MASADTVRIVTVDSNSVTTQLDVPTTGETVYNIEFAPKANLTFRTAFNATVSVLAAGKTLASQSFAAPYGGDACEKWNFVFGDVCNGSTCSCATGKKQCGNICISNDACCQNSDCSSSQGAICRDHTCTCPDGQRLHGYQCAQICTADNADACPSHVCDIDGTCTPPPVFNSCDNGVKDGNETDVDCGGKDCQSCLLNRACTTATDCRSNLCTSGQCAAPGFKAMATLGDGQYPTAAAFGDLDHDGNIDMVLANDAYDSGQYRSNYFTTGIAVHRGNGNGVFGPATRYDLGWCRAQQLLLAKVDTDDNLDLVLVCSYITWVARGKGDGSFEPFRFVAYGGGSAVLGDFDSDGHVDLALMVAPSGSGDPWQLRILKGNGDLSFRGAAVIFEDSSRGSDSENWSFLTAANLDGDTHLDLAFAYHYHQVGGCSQNVCIPTVDDVRVQVLNGNGDLTFQTHSIPFAKAIAISGMVADDFDGNGNTDLVVLDHESDYGITTLFGHSDGSFTAGNRLPTINGALLSGKMTATSTRPDLLISGIDPVIDVHLNDGSGSFSAASPIYPPFLGPLSIVDLNSDGLADAVMLNPATAQVSALLNQKGSVFPKLTQSYLSGGAGPWRLLARDIDNDGKIDLLTGNRDSANLTLYSGNGDGTFQPPTYLGNTFSTVDAGDIDGDGKVDLLVGGNGPLAWLDGNSGLTKVNNLPNSYYDANDVHLADLRRLGKKGQLDIVFRSGSDVNVLLAGGAGTYPSPLTSYQVATTSQESISRLIVQDVGNGFPDILTPWTILVNDGSGALKAPVGNYAFGDAALGDFNDDHFLDRIGMIQTDPNNRTQTVHLEFGDGTGAFGGPVQVLSTFGTPRAVAVADFNGDGQLDVAVTGTTDQFKDSRPNMVSILLGNGKGGFKPMVNYEVGYQPFSIVTADFNGDAKPDLAVANQASGTVSILLNTFP